MKDIDFDELDRAVSSLMSKTGDNSPQSPTSPSPPKTTDNGVSISVTNNSAPVVPAVEASPKPSNGRFMDMVPAAPKPRSAIVSREGVTVAPRPDGDTQPNRPNEPPTRPQEPHPSSASSESKTPQVGWPDPLDMATPVAASPSPSTPTAPVVPKPDTQDTFESPFLTDAKVEKRPLNAGTAGVDQASEEEREVTPTSDVKSGLPPQPPTPAELSGDLIAIESSDIAATSPNSKTTPSEKVDHLPLNRLDEHTSGPAGPTSIAQQYKEQPSSGDQSHAAIYDASQYAQPLAHPAKKSSGWLWVLWVLLLLAIGVGGTFAAYSLGIIT